MINHDSGLGGVAELRRTSIEPQKLDAQTKINKKPVKPLP